MIFILYVVGVALKDDEVWIIFNGRSFGIPAAVFIANSLCIAKCKQDLICYRKKKNINKIISSLKTDLP